MNNPIEHCLNQIFYRIPNEILNNVFQEASQTGFPLPTHEVIRQKIIVGRVLKECNIYGGKLKYIPLKAEYEESVDQSQLYSMSQYPNFKIYRIPEEEREGVEISDVIEVNPPMSNSGQIPYPNAGLSGGGSTAQSKANDVLESYTGNTYFPKPMVELMSGDLVRLSPANYIMVDWVLTVKLCFDQNFTNMNNSAIMPMADLCVAATKSYIYNQLIIQLDRVSMEAGTELSNFRSIIEGYEPAEDEYRELLQQFAGGNQLDPQRMRQVLYHML